MNFAEALNEFVDQKIREAQGMPDPRDQRIHDLEQVLQSFVDFVENPTIAYVEHDTERFTAMHMYSRHLILRARALLNL